MKMGKSSISTAEGAIRSPGYPGVFVFPKWAVKAVVRFATAMEFPNQRWSPRPTTFLLTRWAFSIGGWGPGGLEFGGCPILWQVIPIMSDLATENRTVWWNLVKPEVSVNVACCLHEFLGIQTLVCISNYRPSHKASDQNWVIITYCIIIIALKVNPWVFFCPLLAAFFFSMKFFQKIMCSCFASDVGL